MRVIPKKTGFSLGILTALLLCMCGGCGSRNAAEDSIRIVEETIIQEKDMQKDYKESDGQDVSEETQSGEDLDMVFPTAADNTWYMTGDIYTDENGRRLEVFYDDEGMLQFAVDGLSLYNTMADRFQTENNWRIYTCDDGTTVVYYPGAPAHLEITDGEYAGVYEADNSE